VNVIVDREIGGPGTAAAPGAMPGMMPGMAPATGAVAPPGPGPAPFPAAAGGGAGSVAGVVDIDPGQASKLAPGDTLFIIVKNAPVGPPLAVKKIVGPTFPVPFDIGPADAMMGPDSWTAGPFWISARLDKDGNAMSKGPGDVAGKIESPVPAGATGLRVVLAEPL
jgi:hypothetical protein